MEIFLKKGVFIYLKKTLQLYGLSHLTLEETISRIVELSPMLRDNRDTSLNTIINQNHLTNGTTKGDSPSNHA